MATYIISGIIVAAVVLAIIKLIRDKKNGKTCNCGCDGCSSACKKINS